MGGRKLVSNRAHARNTLLPVGHIAVIVAQTGLWGSCA